MRADPSGSGTWSSPLSTDSTSATVTGLLNGTSYDVEVRSRDGLGNTSAWSAPVSATPIALHAPITVTVTAPATGTRVSGTVDVAAKATDDAAPVTSLDLLVDGQSFASTAGTWTVVAW